MKNKSANKPYELVGIVKDQSEFGIKLDHIRQLLKEKELDALLLQRQSSIAWATCGADVHINTAASDGACVLLITPDERFVFTNNIEASRLKEEENFEKQGWTFKINKWFMDEESYGYTPYCETTSNLKGFVKKFDKKIGHDGLFAGGRDLAAELAWLRAQLTLAEGERFRILGRLCAESMNEAIQAVRPGMSEFQIAALLAEAAENRGVQAIVNLVGTDERIFQYRHAIPTAKKLEKYAMLVLCGRKWGLVCSVTRLVHFGELPGEVERKMQAVAAVDAVMLAATRPGNTLKGVFAAADQAYAAQGSPDEWQNHHQGGLAGYEPREITATPSTGQPVLAGQVYAWNPSIRGAKSEDSILVGEDTNEVLTAIEGWPMIEIEAGNQRFQRPAVLIKD